MSDHPMHPALVLALVLALASTAEAQAPALEITPVFATGAREVDELRDRDVAAPLARCDGPARRVGERAQATFRMEIDARGRVSSTRVVSTPARLPHADAWHDCVIAALGGLRFGAGGRGAIDVVVEWHADAREPAPLPDEPPMVRAAPAHARARITSPPREPAPELTRDAIRDLVRANLAPIARCYEREARERPDLAGRLRVRFSIAPDGTVDHVSTIEDELGSPTLDTCVRYHVRGFRFPRHAGPALEVVYPFVFGRR